MADAATEDEDSHPHLRPMTVPAPMLQKWKFTAERIGTAGIGLQLELESFERDPTLHMLGRVAKAATFTAASADGDIRAMALAIKAEVEAVQAGGL